MWHGESRFATSGCGKLPGKNKTRLVGWHPSDPELVAWLDAEIERRGGGRGAQSAILDEALKGAAMNDAAERLAEIRGILAAFDWEHDDSHYALERIEMIADDGQEQDAGSTT
jgi:hypothetical protein